MINFFDVVKDRIQGKAPKGARRSSKWRKVRKAFLKTQPVCQVCGGKKKLSVHHIVPFHIAPDLELEPENLITLCEGSIKALNCHLLVGHLGNYRKANTTCYADALYLRTKLNRKGLQ